MLARKLFGWSTLVALVGSGVAACSGAEVREAENEEPVASQAAELRGGSCAGPREGACAEGHYCSGRMGRCPGERHPGRCAERPEVCNKLYAPVCGCDGVTYGNACMAAAEGVSVAKRGACVEPDAGAACGGIAGIPCPKGETCVDDPGDDCDPKNGGADCGGICVAAPEPPPFCGGIAGVPCPKGQACVDDPSDDCDPDRGGADCGGICVSDGAPCGDVTCGPGTVCCNPLRGICTKPGMVCIQ